MRLVLVTEGYLRTSILDVVGALTNLEHITLSLGINLNLADVEWVVHPLHFIVPMRSQRVTTTAMRGTAANKGLA